MTKKPQTREHRAPAPQRAPDGHDTPTWPMDDLAAAWMGLPWIDLWMKTWTAWVEQCGANVAALQGAQINRDDRRQPGMAWLPQVESTVIPLRRRDDHPGTEAAKVSLRFRVPALPWTAGTSNIIAIDTLVPRLTETSADTSPTKQ